MSYITLNDIFDEVLTCTDEDITVGNDTIDREARRLHAKIGEPVAPIIKRLGVCAACCNRCLMQAQTPPRHSTEPMALNTPMYMPKS